MFEGIESRFDYFYLEVDNVEYYGFFEENTIYSRVCGFSSGHCWYYDNFSSSKGFDILKDDEAFLMKLQEPKSIHDNFKLKERLGTIIVQDVFVRDYITYMRLKNSGYV